MKTAFPSPCQPRFEHIVFFDRQPRSRRARSGFALEPIPSSRHCDEPLEPHALSERLFLRWLFTQAGLDANSYRPETQHRRIGACLRELRVANVTEARELLERDRSKIARAIGALVIGVTSFFRDESAFNDIVRSVLPALPRPPQGRRIWSVGCSDGEELYSMAILLAENGLLKGSDLLGTDCRAPAIARAREGQYNASALRNIPPQWWDKYFEKEYVRLRVMPEVRAALRWRVADVTKTFEPGVWDIILCRNMAMYLRAHVAGDLWNYFQHVLRPGGFLILGKAERPIGARRLSAIAPCIYRRDYG